VSKQRSHSFHVEMFSLKKLNKLEVKRGSTLRSQIVLQLWNILMLRWVIIARRKRVESISTFQPKRL
jgi:hypothetical protein